MTAFVLLLISMNSSYFLRLSPGVMSQGLGGVSIMIDEGLSAFHNPALVQNTKVNCTLSRWLYSTNVFSMGACFKNNSIGISYLNYGGIQGYNEYGIPTNEFNPYNMCLILARKLGLFGVSIKAFGEKIDDYTLYGVCGGISSYIDFGKISMGVKVDNLGKEFAQNTRIPFTTALGLKFTLPESVDIFIESKLPDLEINIGLLYKYQRIRLLLGTKYLRPQNLIGEAELGLRLSDFDFTSGLLIEIKNYEIGYSFVYNELSNAHQFSITFTPYP